MESIQSYTDRAYAEGKAAAEAAASWTVDGNTSQNHVSRVLSMMDEGDPGVWDYLPAMPNLSGEWADDPTPLSLYRDITGKDPEDGATMDAIADAYEQGVSDHFEQACEAELRKAVA